MAPLSITVIGAGSVGRALAGRWQQAGAAVSVAVRDPADARHDPYRAAHELSSVTALPDADVTVLAVPGSGLPELLERQAPQLDGRLLIDASNRVGGGPMHQLPLVARALPRARLYRAFTSSGWETFTDSVAGQQPDMPYAGPDGPDREVVREVIRSTGMRPVWLGDGIDAADVLDGVARVWFTLATGRGLGRSTAFRVLTAGDPS